MKWFKHDSNNRNTLEMKLIRSEFGASGYGIYIALKEVVAEYVEASNIAEWGTVHPLHTIETLAKECEISTEEMKKFLQFCDEKGIFKKQDGRLFDPLMAGQLDNFFERVKRDTKPVRSKSAVNTAIEEKRRDKNRIEKKREEKLSASINYLKQIPEEDLKDFSNSYMVSFKEIIKKAQDLVNYCEMHGKRYKDYKALLRNAISKDFEPRTQKKGMSPSEMIEQSQKGGQA